MGTSKSHETLDGSAGGAVDPFGEVKDFSSNSPIQLGEGEVFAYLSMPKLGEELPIYLGASDYHFTLVLPMSMARTFPSVVRIRDRSLQRPGNPHPSDVFKH